jgi:hypothetical protein
MKAARAYDIPRDQVCTVNVDKCRRYLAWLRHPLVRLELFLDQMEARRRSDSSKIME